MITLYHFFFANKIVFLFETKNNPAKRVCTFINEVFYCFFILSFKPKRI